MSNTSYYDLYKALKADGAVQGDWNSFHKFVGAQGKQGYLNRKKLYDALKADGAVQSNSYEEFNMKLFRGGQASLNAAKQRQTQQGGKPQTAAQMAMSMGGGQKQVQQSSTTSPSGTDYMQNWQLMHKRNDQMTPTERVQAQNMRSRMQQAQKQATRQEQYRANPINRSRVRATNPMASYHENMGWTSVNQDRISNNQKKNAAKTDYAGKMVEAMNENPTQDFNEMMQDLSSPQAQRARSVQQRKDDARNLAEYEIEGNQFRHNDGKIGTITPEIDSLVAPSMKEADDLSWKQYQQDLKNAGNDAYLRNKAWKDLQDNRIKNRQSILADNLSAKLQEIYSQKGLQEHIAESAEKLNMGIEEYVDKYVTPQMMQRAQSILGVKNIEEILPRSATEYVVRRLSDSILGTLSAGQDKSREQIAREQEAMAISDGLEEMPTVKGYKANEGYKSGVGARFTSTAANMAMDSPILGMTGGAANMSVDLGKQVLMRGLAKVGLVKMGAKLTAQQLAFKAANMTMAQKIASGLVEGSAKGALNLGGYSGITAALGQASTGDDTSLSALGKAALGGFKHGAATGAMFGTTGAIMAPWVSKFGINGLETTTGEKWLHGAQKFGATAAGLGVEAGTMMVADNITGDKDISVGTWLEDLVMVGAFKAGEPSNYARIGSALYGLVHNTNNTFRVGKDENGNWRNVDIRMTKDEQNELMNSVSGKNLMDAFVNVDKDSRTKPKGNPEMYKSAYNTFMNDPNVSQSTKEKVNAAMGLFNTTSAKSYRSVNDVQNKQILEYSKNGTLLTRTSYKNAEERRAILYKQKLYRDNEEMRSLVGYSKLKDLQPTDESGEVTWLAFTFLTDKGYNPNETVTEANNARLIAGLRDKNSDLYREWEKYVDRYGTLGELISENSKFDSSIRAGLKEMLGGDEAKVDLYSIMRKDPMKRTDEENKIFYQVKDALESELFPNGKPHEEQSETQGESVASDNNLGTDQPNGEVVKQELGNLSQAEKEMEELIRDNDIFSQNFKKLQEQGLSNPQIYQWMIENGLTKEQLEPFAHYINANARVQGMQNATAQKIEEVVSGVVQDWSYKGELNGQKMNGEQVVYVQDSKGRALIVGSGDVAFDSTTGRAKEGVGDLLICFDPNTKEMVYLKTDDVTFMQTQKPEDFAGEYRQRLQMINSQPYNEAAQEQAMQDARKPSESGKTTDTTTASMEGDTALSQSESNSKDTENNPSVQENPELYKVANALQGKVGGSLSKEESDGIKGVSASNSSDRHLAEHQNGVPDLLPTQENDAPSGSKDTNNSSNGNESEVILTFEDGSPVPIKTDSKGRPTPNYDKMTPEQAAEVMKKQLGKNAEAYADAQIKKAQKVVKDAEKMKIDFNGEPNDIIEQQNVKDATVAAAHKQLEKAEAIKKAMTAKAVADTVAKPKEAEKVEGAHEAGSVPAQKFKNATRLVGNKRTRTLADGETKIRGHYEIVPAESLTSSHDVNNSYKKSEGFPVDENGHTINDRDYENDKAAQQVTDQMALKYNGQAIDQVPVVSDEGIVYDGNGRTMAGQKAAKDGTDKEYINDLLENAENFGFTREQIEQSGIEHPRVVLVTDERLPYDTATFSKFNRNEKKAQNNTEQAVAKAKTLTADEVGAIVADIEGNGSLDAFFNNPKAINDLVRTLQEKGIIGQNEVDGFMDSPERLSAQGKEYVKNLLLGSIFKPDTIRMLGVDPALKTKAINGIRAVMENMKLGDYSLRGEIDNAIQLLYEARRNNMSVDDLLRQSNAFEENARDRYSQIAQALAQALEGRSSTLFRDLLGEYNEIAKNYNTQEGSLEFYEHLSPEQLVEEFVKTSNTIKNNDIKLYGNETGRTETEGGNHAASNEEPAKEAGGEVDTEGNEPTESQQQVDEALKSIATEITKQTGIEVVTDNKVGQSALEDAEATDSNVKYHKETDEETLNQLNNGETIKVYRAMQVIDGKLYPPMAASVGGKLVEANELGVWIRADENPDLAIPDIDPKTGKQKVDKKTGELKWKFKLDKGGKDATGKKATDIPAAYNPYWHMSRSPLNDQFKSAWIRPNIVVVECEVPVSELTSGYKAERAKDAVGEVDWKSGSVSGEVFKQTGRARKVILSRWCKPVRVLDDAEVAQRAKEFVGEAKVTIPENVLTPKQRIAFEKAGFKIGEPEKGVRKSEQILEALEKGLQIDNSVREQRGGRWAGGEVLGMNRLPKENRMNPNELASEITQYHGDFIAKAFDGQPEDSTGVFVSCHNGVWYVYSVSKEDRSINIFDAIPAKREEFYKFKKQVEGYGFDTNAENIFSNLQKNGNTDRRDSDLLDAFLRGGLEPSNRVHSGESKSETNDGTSGLAEQTGRANNKSDETRTSQIKEFRSANGEVYGFTVGGKIYLDTKKMKPETPLHEYTHLWTEALRNSNPTEWENVKGLFDEVEGLKEEVQKLYPELKGDDLYEEMITTFSGREGAKKLEEVVRGLAAEDDKTVEESTKATSFIAKVKEALQKYWKGVADMLHIHFTSAEEVADKVLADWAKGVNLTEIKGKEDGLPQWHDVKEGREIIHADADMAKRASEVWGDAKKFLDKNPDATPGDIQRKFKIGYNVTHFVYAHWKEQNKQSQSPKEPSKDPMQGIKDAAESYKEEKLDAARKAYAEAKASGDKSDIKRTTDELKKLLNEKYKAQHIGLVQRRKLIAEEIGKAEAEKIDKPWAEMDGEERLAATEKQPLTEDEIRNNTSEENQDLIEDAIDYLNGNHGFAQQLAYLKIYDDVRNRHENAPGNSGAENGTQLDATDTTGSEGLGLGTGRESRGVDGQLDSGTGAEPSSREPERREGNQDNPSLSTGEPGDKQGEGNSSELGTVPTRDTNTEGSGATGEDGDVSGRKGRRSSNRSAKPNARRKPTAKQGTTWRGRTESEIKQEAKDAKAGLKAALAEMLKRGRGEASLSLVGLNSKQIEYVPELMKAVKRYGMSLIDQGIYKIKDWMNNIREGIHDDMKAIGFSDQDIEDFIKEMWNSKMTMDGETHTIAEWSSIYGNSQLKKKLAEPLNEKYQRQMDAEPIEVKIGDRKNIEETLPFLLPQQQEDVLKAETQFFGKEHTDREHAYGKGYMFTNGTGTGKTYTGLGIAKRLAKQGKGRILFVTPSQKKVSDWMKDGKNLGLNIRDLDSVAKEKGTTATTESGEGMVITTYANMRQNQKLLETEWDAVIYDESHRIMENKKGAETTGSLQHYMMTNRDENYCFLRLQTINPDYQKMQRAADKFNELRQKEMQHIQKEYKQSHPSATTKDVINATHSKLPKDIYSFAPADGMTFPKLGKAYQEFTQAKQYYYNNVEPKLKEQAKNTWKNTKTVFLSATPFNTRENLDYAEGYIFKFPEDDGGRISGRSRFYLDHFGAAYRYRYNRLEAKSDNPAAIAKQEIAFSDYLQNDLGTMSGRIIDSAYDYSRDFPTVAPDHAETFNQAVEEAVKGKYLGAAYSKTIGDYNYGSALFETMKVANIIQRMKDHLDAGRKIVVFHRRVETKEPLTPPFETMLRYANEMIKDMKSGSKEQQEAIKECTEFRNKYADLLQWEQTLDYSMPREQIAKAFGRDNVLFFSGKESKKVKDKAVDTFNDDDSGKNIIVIQEASGKEGISLHDVTGNHQRVLITLGLPQSPITALQIEGRTYRIGNKSNAIFEYPILGLNSEMMLFGQKFNNQVSTTENLALGSQARNLRDSFAKGILEHSGIVPIDQQGVGGKEFDAPKQSDSDPFDDAVLDYYSNQKLNRNNREGVDYFPTPEPLGYKMMEWANVGEGDTILEPSAGHGAIARYAPKENELLSIEPSQSLFTKLQLKAGGLGRKFLNNTFENYNVANKHDVVVMNPPFGTAGATAIAHLDKAFKHLDEGGRVVALIPRGSTDKKFDKWYGEQKNVAMRAEVDLPDIVFQQAGTSVRCRIVILDKITDDALRSKAGYPEKVDLSGHYDKIEDFFEDLRNVEMPDRIVDTQLKAMKKTRTFKKEFDDIKGVNVNYLDKNGISVFDKNTYRDYSIAFPLEKTSKEWLRENYAQKYELFDQAQRSAYNENSKEALEVMKKLTCKLADMSEDEMQKYIADKKNGGTHFRMELGKTFSNTKENFDGVRDRAVEEKGIVMPNLKKESVKVVPVEKHSFGENVDNILSNAREWAKENLVTTGKSELPTMRDGTPYTISKKAVEKYLSASAVEKSDSLSVHLSVLPKLTDVIQESIEAEIHPDYNKGEDGNRSIENGYGNNVLVHRLYGAVELDGKTYRVKTTMQEFRGGEENKPHSYEVTKIELLEGSETANKSDSLPLSRATNNSKNELLSSPGKRENPDRPHSDAPSNFISAAKLLNGVEKSYDSGKKLLDESKDLTDGDTYFRNSDNSPVKVSDNAPVVVKHIDSIAKKVGGKVNMVNSAEEVTNKQAKERIERGENVTGWYDEKTGEVHLYMPNIHDRYTAEKTIWHETVGHKAMRGLIGDENYDGFLRSIWYDLDKPESAELKKLVAEEMKYNPLNIYDAIEEGIARLAEDGRGEVGFWRNIKNKVSDFFHEIGYRMAPNTKDVKYLLWLSKNLQKNPNDPYWNMRAEAVRYRLEHENIPGVIAKDGMFHDNDDNVRNLEDMPKAEYQEATDGQIHFRTTPSAGTALDRYHRALNAHGYMFTESYMDNMLSLKKLMTAIVPDKKIEDIASSENPYMLQNTMQGAMSNSAKMFEINVMEPLNKAMAQVLDAFSGKKENDRIRNFNLYMIAKHGLERNRVFFVRDNIGGMDPVDGKILQKQWDAEKKDLGDKLRNGSIDLKEYYNQMDEWIRNNVDADFKAEEHDYSGFHGMQEIEDLKAPYDDAEVIQSVMDSEASMEDVRIGSVKDLWSKIHTATSYSLYRDYAGGLQDREAYTHTSQMFDWYVPLRKFDENTAEDVYGYVTEKGDPSSYLGSVLMSAKGRKSLSEVNVLAQIGVMGNMAINNAGKNAIKQAFMRFARNHDSEGLITEGKVWLVKDGTNADGSDRWVESYPQIPDGAAPKTVSNIVSKFEAEMKAKEVAGDAKVLKNNGDIGFKFERAKYKSQHIVDVKVNGQTHRFYINGNPRAAQALNGLLEHKAGAFGKPFAIVSRFMAQACTSYNPEFVMRNMVKDFEFASTNLLAKEGARYTAVFEKYYAQVGLIEGIRNSKLSDFKSTGGFGLFRKYRDGTLDTNDKIQRYFKEFMENGGETGWVQMKSIKDWTTEYKRNIKTERNGMSKIGKGVYNAIFKNLENVNEIAENMARFATYCASRDAGRSTVRSAYDAKEVSTNFNRHGSGSEIKSFKNGEMSGSQSFRKNTYRFTSAYFRNTSMFFNAGIQSTNLLIKNFKNNKAGTLGYIVAGPMISGMAIALLNNFLISMEDETDRNVKDPYGELPDYIRRNNLCIYTGGGKFITIPLAIEERAFYGLGDLAAGLTFAKNVSGQKDPYLDAVGCMSQLVPVADYLGNASFGKHPVEETVKAIAPSALSPFVEWAYNSDWKGSPIQRDNKFDENQPAWMLAYHGTPEFLININKKANAWSNNIAPGNENMKGNDFLDAVTNPSGLQHFYSGYLGGAATFAERTLGLIKNGKDVEVKDIPFIRSFFYTPSEQTSLQRTKSKWYNYKDEMAKAMSNAKRLQSKNVPINERLQNIGDYYHFRDSKDARKIDIIEGAEKEMKQWKTLRGKATGNETIKNANQNIDMIMMRAVDRLDKLN